MTAKPLSYPPPMQDMATLCLHICATQNTVDKWVAEGILPPPRMTGGKKMWFWPEVQEYLTRDGTQSLDADAERIKRNVKRDLEGRPGH
jgi:hypothetical protein